MTDSDLRALAEKATPGPLTYYCAAATDDGPGEVLIGASPDGPLWSREASHQAEDDARLIVAACNALPALLDRLSEAEAERDALRAALQRIVDGDHHDIDNPDLDYQAIARAALLEPPTGDEVTP
jgi:hypothetical protein